MRRQEDKREQRTETAESPWRVRGMGMGMGIGMGIGTGMEIGI
jgi:hypothetical protein